MRLKLPNGLRHVKLRAARERGWVCTTPNEKTGLWLAGSRAARRTPIPPRKYVKSFSPTPRSGLPCRSGKQMVRHGAGFRFPSPE